MLRFSTPGPRLNGLLLPPCEYITDLGVGTDLDWMEAGLSVVLLHMNSSGAG